MKPNQLSPDEEVIAAMTEFGRIRCPRCADDRKKKNLKTCRVDVNYGETLWFCHHCEEGGRIVTTPPVDKYDVQPKKKVTPIPTKLNKDTRVIEKFFGARGVVITDKSRTPPMITGKHFFPACEKELEAVGFVYGPKEKPDAIKWRAVDRKQFTQTGSAKEFYGLDQLDEDAIAKGDQPLIIVEGECDAVALASIGIQAISCPNGAPVKISRDFRLDPDEDGKFGYVWESRELIESAKKIILAVDQDDPGEALAEELSRRVGRAKCWRVKYPDGCKDINDVLLLHGADGVNDVFNKLEPVPLAGVYAANDYKGELSEIYLQGYGKGESTGFDVVDELFTIKESQLSIVTGLPSSGKSEFIDQLMVNLAINRNWKFAVASFENPPAVHIAKLAEKIVGKPFFEGVTPRMRKSELDEAHDFINDHFVFLEQRDGKMATVDSIIDRTKQAVMRLGVRGLVIDPYNWLAINTDDGEHSAISKMLSEITAFCQAYGIHVWFVAHPAKMHPREDGTFPVPTGMHISGSAAWFAKADVGITVHRGDVGVEIHAWKVRFKWIGQQGKTVLGYDIPTGRYFEKDPSEVKNYFTSSRFKSKGKNKGHWQDDDWGDDDEDLPF